MPNPDVGSTTGPTIRVLVVDDHELLADSLVRLLSDDPRIEVVGSARTASSGLDMARQHRPHVVIMDFQLPDFDGATATRLLKAEMPEVQVITMTGSEVPGAYFAAMDAGSSAWVRKTRAAAELRRAVHVVASGEQFIDDELADLPTEEELAVYYQPIIDLNEQRLVGFEALVRWNHPTRGVVLPEFFLARAEDTGLIDVLTRTVVETASHQLVEWRRKFPGHDDLWVSVNLSASSLHNQELLTDIATIVTRAGVGTGQLVLELTETVLIEDAESSLRQMDFLKRIGLGLALDDFGTAFSSLAYLRRFPFDHLKIDTSFTAELPGSARSMMLVEAIQQLAAAIGLRGVAEGIERPEQSEALRAIGWELGQGFLYAAAAPPQECEVHLTRKR